MQTGGKFQTADYNKEVVNFHGSPKSGHIWVVVLQSDELQGNRPFSDAIKAPTKYM